MTLALPILTLVIDRRLYRPLDEGAAPMSLVEAAIDGGISMLQLRLRTDSAADDLAADAIAHRLREISNGRVPFLITSDLQLAERSRADGVVLVGDRSYRPAAAKEYLRAHSGTIVGCFADSVAAASRAERNGADFVQVAAAFDNDDNLDEPLVMVRKVKDAIHLPLVAFGGVDTPERAAAAVNAGADGIAVTKAILEASDPRAAASALREAIAR